MKYKVGICLYGLPREIEICQKFNAPFFEKLNIQPYYFCHTWLTTDYKFKKTYNYSDYIENNIKHILGPNIKIIDTVSPVVNHVINKLSELNIQNTSSNFGSTIIYYNGNKPNKKYLSPNYKIIFDDF